MSTVGPTARRSCGPGRVGRITRSAWPITYEMDSVIAGSVSITASFCKLERTDLDEQWFGRLAGIPPLRQAALRIRVDQGNWTHAGIVRFHCQMAGQRGLSGSALLRRQHQNVHVCALSVSGAVKPR